MPDGNHSMKKPCESCVGQRINSENHLSIALYKTQIFCQDMGFNAVNTAKITTAASELIRNIIKYAGNGQLFVNMIEEDGKKGIEIVASDEGPGIEDLQSAMQDNYSSTGTLGLGLPGVERLMDCFTIQTEPQKGTTVTVRKYL